jgi:hypothetical protein
MVIIIDALDECDDKDLLVEFVEAITAACREGHGLPFRLLITSRAEEHIRKKLGTPEVCSSLCTLSLEDFDASSDIRLFFRSRFSTIYQENRRIMQSDDVLLPWPPDSDVDVLTRKSSGSFIFAFTLINFVNDGSDLPHRKLPMALKTHAGLDPLYRQVLFISPRNQHFERVIGTILLIRKPFPIATLADLLQLSGGDVLSTLSGIHSIIMIPEDENKPVLPFHTSLRDFLTLKDRSGDFFVDPPLRHLFIMMDCLKVLTTPPVTSFFESEAQRYACGNWYHHLDSFFTEGGDTNLLNLNMSSLMNHLLTFMQLSLEPSVNTQIWNDKLKEMCDGLSSLLSHLRVCYLCLV